MVRRKDLWTGTARRKRVVSGWIGRIRLDFQYDRRTGFRLVAYAVLIQDARGCRYAGREVSVMPKKPEQSAAGGQAPTRAATGGKMLEKTPNLASYLLDLSYEDSAGPREPSYLLLKAAGGEWLVTMKDPTEARQLRVRVTDLGTMFAALEALLVSPACPWEPDMWATNGRKKRR